MTELAYYNEHDLKPASWLTYLIADQQINYGYVDSRDVQDVRPEDLAGYTRHHFFAGIGGWDYALRLAGWPEDRPVWTASLPCQPFSNAGQQRGTDDKRHLWPTFRGLVEQCLPPVIFGEQVASKLGRAWLATVQIDMAALGYITAAADLCAAGVGAPHIRQRLYWCAVRQEGQPHRADRSAAALSSAGGREVGGLGDTGSARGGRDGAAVPGSQGGSTVRKQLNEPESAGAGGGLANTSGEGLEEFGEQSARDQFKAAKRSGTDCGLAQSEGTGRSKRGSGQFTRGTGFPDRCSAEYWSDVVWLPCADGKARPIKPGIKPLVTGVPGRVGLLRGYGNAIVPQVAAIFVRSVMESLDD